MVSCSGNVAAMVLLSQKRALMTFIIGVSLLSHLAHSAADGSQTANEKTSSTRRTQSTCKDKKFRFWTPSGKRYSCTSSETRRYYCSDGAGIKTIADAVCPSTCGKCDAGCVDAPPTVSFGRTKDKTEKTCIWLKRTGGMACSDGPSLIRLPDAVCPVTCGKCKDSASDPVPAPTPRPLPTPKPRPVPSPTPPRLVPNPVPRPVASPTPRPNPSPVKPPTAGSGEGKCDYPKGDPPRGYQNWNYDPKDNDEGPEGWKDIDDKQVQFLPDHDYWNDYGSELKKQLQRGFGHNYCDGYEKDQSPVDLDNVRGVNYECYEYHELRDEPGNYGLCDSEVKMEIKPNKLRIRWPGKLDDKNPTCDIPKGWGHHFPVLHVDVFFPSAHTIEGKQFPGEYQVWVLTNRGRGMAVFSIMMDYGPHNSHFQLAINEWQKVYDDDESKCKRRERRLGGSVHNVVDFHTEDNESFRRIHNDVESERKLAHVCPRFDPFHSSFFRSYYWWGYKGTTMELPCYPIAEYRVLDTPMFLSEEQFNDLRRIFFTHKDDRNNCRVTSVHHDCSVARPTQPLAGRDLHRCTCINYYPDKKRKMTGYRDCKADKTHPWYKRTCPDWYGDICPTWYDG